MQSIEKIASQNAAVVALSQAKENGVPFYVYRGEDGKLAITDDDTLVNDDNHVFTAKADGTRVKEG